MMSFEDFMSQLLRPTYVWRMASAKNNRSDSPMARGARTSMARARRQIDDLVLLRAAAIADERRCAAITSEPSTGNTIRCEYQRGHDPVPGRRGDSTGTVMHDRKWDHAVPSRGVWWMQPEEAHA